MKLWKRLCAVMLSAALLAGFSVTGASACTSLYVGSELSENGSTYFGRGEDIGEEWTKVFQIVEAADHEEGEEYVNIYGSFVMPYPAHTYRYTYVRDSLEYGENVVDEETGKVVIPAYAQAGINELGVSVTATVSTIYDNDFLDAIDGGPTDEGICEQDIAGVILQSATSARNGVEILAAVLDEYGAGYDYGYYNSILIGDTEEVWNFQVVSAHNYVAVRLPADKVSINPNMVTIGEIDVSDTDNVVASEGLISLPLKNGFLVSSQLEELDAEEITKINIRETYGTNDGSGQYTRYWQGVNYLNEALAATLDIETRDEDGKLGSAELGGPVSYLFDPDRQLSTYEILRFFATRGEGTDYDSNESRRVWPIGNEHQAEVHVFEIRSDSKLPAELATVEWLAMNRAEYSVFLPFYSALLTDTAEVYQCDWTFDEGSWDAYGGDLELFEDEDYGLNDPSELPENSMFWVFAALNDLCDNDRERYGVNVKAFWEDYQNALIEQQETVDAAMYRLYSAKPGKLEEAATELGKAVAEETFDYAQQILTELWEFIQADEAGELDEGAVFTPSVLGELPTYAASARAIAAELNPSSSSGGGSSSGSSTYAVSNGTSKSENGTISLNKTSAKSGAAITVTAVPDEGYEAASVTVTTVSGKTVDVTDNGDGTYSFTMPSGKVTVTATFREIAPAAEIDLPFVDVPENSWAYDAISYAYANSLFAGTSATTFGFSDHMTRQQFWTVLARMSGYAPTDMDDARAWAMANIGSDGSNPTGEITREQFVTLLWRYAGSPASSKDLSGYADFNSVADYAKDAMRWAVENGIVSGTSAVTLSPAASTTRAQAAVILVGFSRNAEA